MIAMGCRVLLVAAMALCLGGCESGDGGGGKPEGGGATASAGDAAAGRQKFVTNCSTCHGEDAGGVQGLGKPLKGSPYVHEHPVEELVKLILEGRAADHPENTTGIAMPPKGGNPGLTEQDVRDIAAYVKSLQ